MLLITFPIITGTIVADEVGKLADQIGHSVTDISNIVMTIQDAFRDVTTELDHAYAEVKEDTVQIQRLKKNSQVCDGHVCEYAANF